MARWTRVAVVVAMAFSAVALGMAADVWQDLGLPQADVASVAADALVSGTLPSDALQKLKAAGPAQRVVLVKGAAAAARTLVGTPAFLSAFTRARNETKPQPPESALSLDERLKKQLSELDAQEAELKKQMAGSPALKQALDALAGVRQQMQAMSKDPQMKAMAEAESVEERQEYRNRLAEFDREHPADPKAAVAGRLRQWLDACRDVDFAATTKPSGGRRVFSNDSYEAKSTEWKLCYRAGREPVEAARALAEAWLKELGR